jgi:hypothetical protein
MDNDSTGTDPVVLPTYDDSDDDQQHMHQDTNSSGNSRPDTTTADEATNIYPR